MGEEIYGKTCLCELFSGSLCINRENELYTLKKSRRFYENHQLSSPRRVWRYGIQVINAILLSQNVSVFVGLNPLTICTAGTLGISGLGCFTESRPSEFCEPFTIDKQKSTGYTLATVRDGGSIDQNSYKRPAEREPVLSWFVSDHNS